MPPPPVLLGRPPTPGAARPATRDVEVDVGFLVPCTCRLVDPILFYHAADVEVGKKVWVVP
jgi:hypothetical protein